MSKSLIYSCSKLSKALLLLLLFSCDRQEKNICNKLDQIGVITLRGTVDVDSKGHIVFIPKDENEAQKIELIPCNEQVRQFVLQEYDRSIYLKNAGEAFWIAVEGNFISTDKKEAPRKFLFRFAALLDEQQETGKGIKNTNP